MSEMAPFHLLRTAAAHLSDVAGTFLYDEEDLDTRAAAMAEYTAAVSPSVGILLADWLGAFALDPASEATSMAAIAVANAIVATIEGPYPSIQPCDVPGCWRTADIVSCSEESTSRMCYEHADKGDEGNLTIRLT